MISFRNLLAKIGEPGADGKFPRFRSGFASAPASLRAACRAMENPVPSSWPLPAEEAIDAFWTQNCQGVTWDGSAWYFASNGSAIGTGDVTPRAIFKRQGGRQVGKLVVPNATANHLGDLDYWGGNLHAALEGSPHSPHRSAVLMVNTSFTWSQVLPLLGADGGEPPQGGSMPWCAVNPWNGLLYSSKFDGVNQVFAYELTGTGWRHRSSATITLRRTLERVQGGCFSPNGHLYLTSDVYVDETHKAVEVFSALNGAYRGRILVLALDSDEELEGLCFARLDIGGHDTHLHVVLLDVHTFAKDDIFLKHYRALDPVKV